MRWVRTLLLFLLLFCLIAYYAFYINSKKTESEAHKFSQKQKKIFSSQDEIEEMIISRDARQNFFHFKRDSEEHWVLIQPVSYPAEQGRVEELISLMQRTDRIRNMPIEGADVNDFHFENGPLRICLSVGGERKNDFCLDVGRQATLPAVFYAKWEGEDEIFQVSETFIESFQKSLYQMREKLTFTLPWDQVKQLHVRTDREDFIFAKYDSTWMAESPVEFAIGEQLFEALSGALNALHIKQFMDDTDWRNKKFGLAPAVHIIRITSSGGEQTLIVGKKVAGQDAYYAKMQNRDTVFLIAKSKLDAALDILKKMVR